MVSTFMDVVITAREYLIFKILKCELFEIIRALWILWLKSFNHKQTLLRKPTQNPALNLYSTYRSIERAIVHIFIYTKHKQGVRWLIVFFFLNENDFLRFLPNHSSIAKMHSIISSVERWLCMAKLFYLCRMSKKHNDFHDKCINCCRHNKMLCIHCMHLRFAEYATQMFAYTF